MGLNIVQEIRARAWQAATVGTAVALLGVSGAWLIEKHDHGRTRAELTAVQTDRDELVTRLAIANGNITNLSVAIDERNKAIDAQASRDAAALAEAGKRLAAAQAATAKANAKVADLMRPLVGQDYCSRVVEMDERIMKDLAR